MRIGIDARFLTHPQPGGFKTYSESLIAALAAVDTENEYILYLDRPPERDTKLPGGPNFSYNVILGSIPLLGMPWREQVRLSRQASRDRLHLLHSPSLTAPLRLSCPSVVTMHDMIWYFPQKFAKQKSPHINRKLIDLYYRTVPELAARKAAVIITVSQASKENIIQTLAIPAEKIFVTHEAANCIYRQVDDAQQIDALLGKYGLSSDYIMAIGSADPRKNVAALVQAYALLPTPLKEKYRLVVVWTHHLLAESLEMQIEKSGLNGQVQFLENVSNDDMVLLYNAASLFVFPSLYEGFGLPLLEAMACGTPVVTADNSSIPEIVGGAGLLVDAGDVNAMACKMTQALSNETVRAELIQNGLDRAASFSWQKCAKQTIDAYEQALLTG